MGKRWYENWDSLEEAPFSFKVLGDIVLCGGKDLFDSNIYAKVRSYKARELEVRLARCVSRDETLTLVYVSKGT
jgi:hypothetical protein